MDYEGRYETYRVAVETHLNGLFAGGDIGIGSKSRRGDQSDGEQGDQFVHDASFWCGLMEGGAISV